LAKRRYTIDIRANHSYPSRRSAVLADSIVAASQPLAAQAGLLMLARGGNAVDAAIATAITLTLLEPTSSGVGSDAFAIVWDGIELHGLNASGRSPAGWTPDRFAAYETMPFLGWDALRYLAQSRLGWRYQINLVNCPLSIYSNPPLAMQKVALSSNQNRRTLAAGSGDAG
jgi:hypothetical protein